MLRLIEGMWELRLVLVREGGYLFEKSCGSGTSIEVVLL